MIVYVEGNIGSGKSELIKNLVKNKHIFNKEIILLEEPVNQWSQICDEKGITILENFYNNKEKYAYAFQSMAFISRLVLLDKTVEQNPNAIIISERSLFTDKFVFAQMLHDEGYMNLECYTIYMMWFNHFANKYNSDHVIYIKTDPEICSERINIRRRQGENIPINYLINCDKYHEKMIEHYNEPLIINGNLNCHDDNVLNDWLNSIKEKIERITI